MQRKSCIAGYDEAIEQERALREEAIAFDFDVVCKVRVNHITPRILSRLFQLGSPFFGQGDYSFLEVAKFLWSVSKEYSDSREALDAFLESTLPKLAEIGLDDCVAKVGKYLDDTFLDAPVGGSESVPYVCSSAWMIFKMMCEPLRMTREQAKDTPVREIYQYLRCAKYERGDILYNSISDPLKSQWLADLREGKVTLN